MDGLSSDSTPHKRDRIWIVAHSTLMQRDGGKNNAGVFMEGHQISEPRNGCWSPHVANATGLDERKQTAQADTIAVSGNTRQEPRGGSWWRTEPDVGRVVDGLADGPYRLKAIGNGQVPSVAATAFHVLHQRMMNRKA